MVCRGKARCEGGLVDNVARGLAGGLTIQFPLQGGFLAEPRSGICVRSISHDNRWLMLIVTTTYQVIMTLNAWGNVLHLPVRIVGMARMTMGARHH